MAASVPAILYAFGGSLFSASTPSAYQVVRANAAATAYELVTVYSRSETDTLLANYATSSALDGKLAKTTDSFIGTLTFLDGSDNTTASVNSATGVFSGVGTGLTGVALLASANVFAAPSASSSATIAQSFTATYTNSSGSSTPYVFTVTDSTTGTAGFSALVVNRAGSGTGSASKFLLDLRDGGSTKLSVDRFGSGIFSGNLQGGNLYTQGFLRAAGSGANIAFTQSFTNVSATRMTFSANGSAAGTSGTEVCVSIAPTYNQASGTAANTDLLINRTQTAVGSGAQRYLDIQLAGTSKFYIDNTTVAFIANGTAPAGTPSGGGFLYVVSGELWWKGSSGTSTKIAVA